nr:cytochrome B ubiquinol-cytochrome C reductase subunit [Haplopteris ensiformis]UQV94709.1 cytochrome B ubiquinol-cytochrome Creductasesubunit [Haplopteris ensiformis]UQV94728.1 cytochrome B ubiquinol-cytochrome Creductasesubunit [Haplopteris ensiformis]
MTKRLSILKQPLFHIFNKHLIDYPTPSNISYWWGFGSLAGLCLVIQIITGVFLAMHYTPHVNLAFNSVEHIMRDVKGGWLLRYMHANGASMFFTAVYIHIFRGLYYGSYTSPREFIWCFGVVIFLLMIVTAFIGYVLPWGQMSFWGATVITSLASAVPKVGNIIVTWLWGGFSVDNATLNRFFSLHYLLPFAIVGVSIIHLAALHQYGSNNPLGIRSSMDKIVFYPYFYVKDLVGWVAFAIFFSIWLFYAPNALGHPDNYMPANPMSTPAHIVPEWYFLPIYAILRSIPNKLGGVVAIGLVFVSLLALPFLNFSAVRSSSLRPIHQRMFCFFLMDCFLLTWVGCNPVEAPYVLIGQMGTSLFYFYFIVGGYISKMEYYIKNKYVPVDISTKGGGVLLDYIRDLINRRKGTNKYWKSRGLIILIISLLYSNNISLIFSVISQRIVSLVEGPTPGLCAPSHNIEHALFNRELSGRRLSVQDTLHSLPSLNPDHVTTGRPLSLERAVQEFSNVPEEDVRRSLLGIW